MSTTPEPDFLCIGMQKAGTRWIYDRLRIAPQAQMLPLKEFHHFDSAEEGSLLDGDHQARLRRTSTNGAKRLPKTVNDIFFRDFEHYLHEPSDSNYCALFRAKNGRIAGDITPAYSRLSAESVEKVASILPKVKVILSIREPVARAWSHFNMHLRRRMKANATNHHANEQREEIKKIATLDALEAFAATPEFVTRSFPSRVLEHWRRYFPNLLVLDFSQIVSDPDGAFRRIHEYLCMPGDAVGPSVGNRKANRAKASMGPEHAEFLGKYFEAEIERCNEIIPEIAVGWRQRDRSIGKYIAGNNRNAQSEL